MLDILYPFSYFASLTTLILWFFFKENRLLSGLMRNAFFGSFLVYFLSLFFSPGMLSIKFFALFRDLVAMGVIAQFFSFFKSNKLVFFIMLSVLIGSFQFKGKSYLQSTFAIAESQTGTTTESDIPLFAPEGELLLEINPNHSIDEIEPIFSKYDLTYKTAFYPERGAITDLDDYLLVDIPAYKISEMEEIISALKAIKAVDWVEKNEVFQINPILARKSPRSKKVYGVDDPDIDKLWGFKVMKMDQLYQLLKERSIAPTRKAKVFIIDSGVDSKHEDLRDRYRSIDRAYDTDANGHGTHCAGIAAAVTNNGKGVASVFPNNDFAEVSGIKVVNFMGLISQQRLIEGIIEAIDNGADVVSVSIGARSREAAQEAFQEVVDYANQANTIIVVAAGNDNQNAQQYTPANAEGVITVSAIDTFLHKAGFSNTVGTLQMGVAAPGTQIYSTYKGNQYKALSGTSMACPYVSGLVGLLKSIDPNLTASQVYEILNETGKQTTSTSTTGKLIQPADAVKMVLERKNGI